MTPTEIAVKVMTARREMEYWQGILDNRNCRECEHGQTAGWCSKYQAAPPAEVQRAGCDEWTWCAIPF